VFINTFDIYFTKFTFGFSLVLIVDRLQDILCLFGESLNIKFIQSSSSLTKIIKSSMITFMMILGFQLVFGSKLSQDHSNNHFRVEQEDVINHEKYESTSLFWKTEAQKKLRQHLEKKLNENVAKNLIIFLGDGMSIATITSSRIYSGQKMGFSGEESVLSFEEFPHVGLSKVS
jgi:Alkaline phosphatase